VQDVTRPVGPFRLRYVVERERDVVESLTAGGEPGRGRGFAYGLTAWEVEPVAAQRGEALSAALAPGSEFRQVVDAVDARQTVITFWVYPDSFALYRGLRDFLYQREVEVAARPIPDGVPIRASRSGTRSRGQ
jgi:hypothetical protein